MQLSGTVTNLTAVGGDKSKAQVTVRINGSGFGFTFEMVKTEFALDDLVTITIAKAQEEEPPA